MEEMHKLDIVRLLGNRLTSLDLLMASPDLNDADFRQIRKLRRTLDKMQGEFVAQAFRENTKKFQEAAARLEKVNDELETTIANVEKVAATIAAITSLISSAEKLLSIGIA